MRTSQTQTQNVCVSSPIPHWYNIGSNFTRGAFPPAMVFWFWELAETSDGAEIFIKCTKSNVKFANWEKVKKKNQGAMPPSLKVHTL